MPVKANREYRAITTPLRATGADVKILRVIVFFRPPDEGLS